MRYILLKVFLSALILISCNESSMNSKGITVKGCILDSLTGKPLAKARINVLCWYHAGWDKTDFVNIDIIANENGCFSATFDEGYKVVVASITNNYLPRLEEFNIATVKMVEVKLKLKKGEIQIVPVDKFNLREYIVQNSSN